MTSTSMSKISCSEMRALCMRWADREMDVGACDFDKRVVFRALVKAI